MYSTLFVHSEHEEVRILLNPSYLTHEQWSSRICMKIYGIPHGDKITIELSSSLFTIIESYELTMVSLNDKLITRMNVALEENYFSSASRKLQNEFFHYQHISFRHFD